MCSAIRGNFPSDDRVDKFFQQDVQGLPIPQTRPYWTDPNIALLAKPKFKTYSSSAVGHWKAHYDMFRQQRLAVEARMGQQQAGQAGMAPQQVLEEQQDEAQQQVAQDFAVDNHYREYLEQGLSTETALQFAAQNNIDMTSIPGDPPFTLERIQAAFTSGNCEPLVPEGTDDPDFVL